MKNDPIPFDPRLKEALFRYQAISNVLNKESCGVVRSVAVEETTGIYYMKDDGEVITVSRSTLYRWLSNYEEKGFDGLFDKERESGKSITLSKMLLDYFIAQKQEDPIVSIPELIKRARHENLIRPDENIDRVTVWRHLKLAGVETARCKASKREQAKRFAFPHRMDMVICDGKHFRVGPKRVRRVAFFFIDDATRMVLAVKVGTSENAQLFMQGQYDVSENYGRSDALFVDNGSGFIAHDSIDVLRKLKTLYIHGTPNYPEGRAKAERFNRTVKDQVLRYFPGNPEVDPDCKALELRLKHYVSEIYAHTKHSSLGGDTPYERFQKDNKPLRFYDSVEQLKNAFVLHTERLVSRDNVISYKGVFYELPSGYATSKVMLHRNILYGTLSIIHEGRLLELKEVDLSANARRIKQKKEPVPEDEKTVPPKGSAQMAFERDYGSVVDCYGGFTAKKEKKDD